MKKIALVIVIFCATFVTECLSDGRTPFCDSCACLNQTLTNPDVDCSGKIISSILFDARLWFNKDENATYNIASLNLQRIDLGVLNDTFPASNLKKLDLSNNGIKFIADGVFANLEDMEELILSNNRLQTIGSNVFRVSR